MKSRNCISSCRENTCRPRSSHRPRPASWRCTKLDLQAACSENHSPRSHFSDLRSQQFSIPTFCEMPTTEDIITHYTWNPSRAAGHFLQVPQDRLPIVVPVAKRTIEQHALTVATDASG